MRTTLHPLTPSLRHPLAIPIPFPNFLFRTSSNYRPDLIDDTAALVRVLDECQSPRSLSALRDLHSRLLDRGLASHPSIQVKIMRAYAACGEPARARRVFDDAPVKTTIFFNVMIRSYVAHRLNREALLLFSEMVRLHRVKPDNYTFPCALKACSDSENLQGGLQIHDAIAKLSLDANLFLGTRSSPCIPSVAALMTHSDRSVKGQRGGSGVVEGDAEEDPREPGAGLRGGGDEQVAVGIAGGAEHLGGVGLVVAIGLAGGGGGGADGLEEVEGAGGDDVSGVVGDLKGNGDVGLGGEVVDLVGEEGVDPAAERHGRSDGKRKNERKRRNFKAKAKNFY